MPLSPGFRLGPYEVVSLLGAGGMGEVYRARDSRLGRDVAIKVLPPQLAGDESRRRRFRQEARSASALEHPSIVAIHELESTDGIDFIVMELVSGRTLREIIRSGLKLGEALRIAVPIADALACAHAAGIVHRDLKPANVMVTPEGGVKVLDFGLAKLVERQEGSGEDDTTLSAAGRPGTLSRAGTIAGTPGYMSPEQATGAKVDARSDVFSFGALLYEMVTGRRAFSGSTQEQTLRAVVGQEAKAPSEVVPGVPADLEKLILRCLRKEPERRFQHMSDVKVLLQETREESESAASTANANGRRSKRSWLWSAAGTAAIAVVAAAAWLAWRSFGDALPPPRLVNVTSYRGSEMQPSLSPDGEQVAFSWEGEDDSGPLRPPRHIWVKFVLGGSEARQLTSGPGIDGFPSWSPDGRQVAFTRIEPLPGHATAGIEPVPGYAAAARFVHVVSAQGGPERKLGAFQAAASRLAWSPDGRGILAARQGVGRDDDAGAGAIHLLPLDGAPPRAITRPVIGGLHVHPAVSPDGRHLAYADVQNASGGPPIYVDVVDLDGGLKAVAGPRHLTPKPVEGSSAYVSLAWAPDGRSVVYDAGFRIGYLWRVDILGTTPPERVELAGRGVTYPFAAPGRARLVFVRRLGESDIWAFEKGKPERPAIVSTFDDREPSYSPDGRRVAFGSTRSADTRELWIANADGTNPIQMTRGPGTGVGSPRWSPDGARIVYDSRNDAGTRDLWIVDVSGGAPRRLTYGPANSGVACWSRDNRWVYYRGLDGRGFDMWRVPADGGKPERVTDNARRAPQFAADRCSVSFDGRTLYYKQAAGEASLIAHPLDGKPERAVVDCVSSRAFDVGPDGIYYLGCWTGQRTQPFYRLDSDSGRLELLGNVDWGNDVTISASPTGGPTLFTRFLPEHDIEMIENFR
jgi:serine/threonine protein kinase/Tol biopolymer transport system component